MVSQITSLAIVYSTVYSGAGKKTSKLRVTGLCEGNSPVTANSPHKWPVTRKMFPFDDVIMIFRPTYDCDTSGPLLITDISQNSIGIRAWISNCMHVKTKMVITHPCRTVSTAVSLMSNYILNKTMDVIDYPCSVHWQWGSRSRTFTQFLKRAIHWDGNVFISMKFSLLHGCIWKFQCSQW